MHAPDAAIVVTSLFPSAAAPATHRVGRWVRTGPVVGMAVVRIPDGAGFLNLRTVDADRVRTVEQWLDAARAGQWGDTLAADVADAAAHPATSTPVDVAQVACRAHARRPLTESTAAAA